MVQWTYGSYAYEGGFSVAVTVVFGKAGSGKTAYCFDEIKDWTAQGGKAILLVPDQATYGLERRFAETMPCKGFAGTQVLGFSRLAYRVFQERGLEHQSLSELSRQIVLQRLLRRYGDELTVLQTAARQPNFVATVGQFIWECRSFCISPDDLRQAAAGLEGQTLARKLEDIAVLYDGYDEFLANHFGTADDVMTLLAREIGNYQFLKGARIWVDGFHWFTPQQMEILRLAAPQADGLTVTLTMDPERVERQRRETALFHRSYEVYSQLKKLFPGLKTKAVTARGDAGLDRFAEGFFQVVPQPLDEPVGELSLMECTNKEIEIDAVARRILGLCQSGCRYRDILILARGSDTYTTVVERVFRSYGIPCFTDYRRPMTEHPAAEAILAVLDVLRSRFAYEPLFRLLKTDLFPLARPDVDVLENYCLAYGIQGYHWLKDEDWSYGLYRYTDDGPVIDVAAQELLERVNAIRRIVTAQLRPLYDAAGQDHSLRDWCTLLYEWLQSLSIPAALRRWKSDDEAAGRTLEGKEHEQVWKQIVVLLNELVRLCGDDSCGLDEFAQMIGDGLADLKFSIIPPTLDHVTFTSVERGYTMQAPVVFVVGINDGVFPQHSGEEGILGDAERQRLKDAGLVLGPGSRFRSFQERFWFYVACTRAGKTLVLSYALAGEDGSTLEASSWIHQLLEKGYVAGLTSETGDVPDGTEASHVLALPAALRYLPVMLRPAVEGQPVADIWWSLYDWAAAHGWQHQAALATQGLFHKNLAQALPQALVRALYLPKGTLRGSVTKFESYKQCPFAYFSRYALQLEERPVYQFGAPDLGMLVHRALRLMGGKLLATGRQWRDIPLDDVEGLCRQATDELAVQIQNEILVSNAYYSRIKERLIQTLTRTVRRLCQFSTASQFSMAALEKSFGRVDSDWQPLQFTLPDGTHVVITGQVDRVDTLEMDDRQFVIVIDYKSGSKRLDLRQVYAGLELQLLTYMFVALLNLDERAVPAAVLYCHVRDDKTSQPRPVDEEQMEKAFNDNNKLTGFYLKDSAVMTSLDTTLQGSSAFLNVYLKNDGTLGSKPGSYFDEPAWQALLDLAGRHIQDISQHLVSGDISIHPVANGQKSPCQYCPYHGLCQFDPQLRENTYRILPKKTVREIVEELLDEGGDGHGLD